MGHNREDGQRLAGGVLGGAAVLFLNYKGFFTPRFWSYAPAVVLWCGLGTTQPISLKLAWHQASDSWRLTTRRVLKIRAPGRGGNPSLAPLRIQAYEGGLQCATKQLAHT
jgi:hypothetical protein